MAESARLLIWCDEAHRTFAVDVARRSSLPIAAVGSPDPAVSTALASLLKCERFDDLRVAVQAEGVNAILFASPDEGSESLRILSQSGHRTLSIDPRPSGLTDRMDGAELESLPSFAPLFRRSPGFLASRDVLPNFGEARCVNIFFRCGKAQGGLFGRLFDAMDIVQSLCGDAEQLDAALASPVPGLPGVPESLAALRGSITINMRFPQNRCACVAVSDQAGAWFRGVTVLGEGGCLRIHDDGFDWGDADGHKVDSHLSRQSLEYVDLVADQLLRLVERRDLSDLPIDSPRLLALCEAARVSCRTGQSETPRKMLELIKGM